MANARFMASVVPARGDAANSSDLMPTAVIDRRTPIPIPNPSSPKPTSTSSCVVTPDSSDSDSTLACASASTTSTSTSPPPSPKPFEPTYDCNGSIMCPTINVAGCDRAVNYDLTRNSDLNYGPKGSGRPWIGVCHGVHSDFGCGIFIEGPLNCSRSGNDIWWDYQDIRQYGCHKCGHKYWTSWGCKTTIDYKPVCDIWDDPLAGDEAGNEAGQQVQGEEFTA
ncbi:hypothetical protein GGR52DRAFT_572448 [Hypoxylon sp. FL1284]|nr:hypothetical protein GGR52DRAFT_572448 [Hypoxylon sp. FL1284]